MRQLISGCLTDEIFVDLLDGRLSDQELATVHQHAAGCDDCQVLLATVAAGLEGKEDEPEPPPEPPDFSSAPDLWTPPSAFAHFRLERLIGRGGMGIVYLAQDTKLKRQVAVKFIAASQPEPWVREYFETEAQALASLQHANIVNVFSVGEVDGHPYIVSEYVDGKSLGALRPPLPWLEVLSLGVGLARGLVAAHRQGVLHRDLKPSNVLVNRHGEVKLLDFGLAERFEAGAELESSSALIVGTVPYMAPELLRGTPASARSDLYSLGLILHELCTGEMPLLSSRRTGAARSRAPLGEEVDPDFAAIILRCLEADPRERFASAEALCEVLERIESQWNVGLSAGNPYRGLAPFEAEHQALFFGRDADIRAVLERLRSRPLVLVAGDSGAGKSSLCRAGVLPRVAAGALGQGRQWTTSTLWPGRRPLEALAAALAHFLQRKEEELVTELADTPGWLGPALREARSRGRGLLLFVDQLEELLTLSEPVQAAHFVRLLGELALPSEGVRVLLAVRGDFLTRLCALPGVGQEAERGLYILRPMSPAGVREAIVGPARSRGVTFESNELVQTLVDSTAHGAGSLPLLQFALAELWEQRDPALGRITRGALDGMGGVAGALSRHADGVVLRLSPAERAAAQRLLLQLVTGEDTRIERGEDELIEASDGAARAALRALIDGRLLHTRTAGGQPRCEIAHDSLIHSWGTLRDWLDDGIGLRVVRKRVEEASAEWDRLMHAQEALWGQRQLDEARPLDSSLLGPRERSFLQASRRAVTRQRWGRWLAVLVLALAVAGVYGGLRLQAYLADARFIEAQLHTALKAIDAGREFAQQAHERRQEALGQFDPPDSESADHKPLAEAKRVHQLADQIWSQALDLRGQSEASYARATRELERALDRDRLHPATRRLLAEITHERVLLAEDFLQRRERDEWMQRLEQQMDSSKEGAEWLQESQAPAEFALVTEPPGARLQVERYIQGEGAFGREPVPEVDSLGPTPLAHVRLPEGSYLLHVSQPGRVPVTLPLLLTNGAHKSVSLMLPTEVPEGYVYIPPGCFLIGSDEIETVRKFEYTSPLHQFCINQGYLIGQREVTFRDWLDYLNALPPEAPARHFLEEPRFGDGGAVSLRQQPGGGWVFSFSHSGEEASLVREGEDFVYPGRTQHRTADWRRFPLSGVSAEDLEGYFSWLDQTKRLPGARLCNEREWEYAARGADGRRYPHGNQLQPDDATIDETYGREPAAFGPDMVGSHPVSVSPFGLEDMAGNAYELTRSMTPEFKQVTLRGGSWYYDAFAAVITNLAPGDPTARDSRVGVRVCASFSPR